MRRIVDEFVICCVSEIGIIFLLSIKGEEGEDVEVVVIVANGGAMAVTVVMIGITPITMIIPSTTTIHNRPQQATDTNPSRDTASIALFFLSATRTWKLGGSSTRPPKSSSGELRTISGSFVSSLSFMSRRYRPPSTSSEIHHMYLRVDEGCLLFGMDGLCNEVGGCVVLVSLRKEMKTSFKCFLLSVCITVVSCVTKSFFLQPTKYKNKWHIERLSLVKKK